MGTDLLTGELTLHGRVMPASNATFVGEVDGVRVVYKPVAGERPLWDFPDGTLAGREVASYAVSEALGWNVVPHTFLRDGPHGLGMVQRWQEPDDAQAAVDLVREGQVPTGWLHVFDGVDEHDRGVALVHEDSAPVRRMAVFDALVNNADRKGGHVLAMTDGHRYGVDHGVTFHVENKLRTVLWGWMGEPLTAAELEAVEGVRDDATGDLGERLARPRRPRARSPRWSVGANGSSGGARCPTRAAPGRSSRGRPSEHRTADPRLRAMRGWPSPDLPTLDVVGPPVRVHDTATGGPVTTEPDGPARLYVCGITPYDATHLGHAATYVAFDLLVRAWRNAGHEVTYVQNVTDVDDPLLERAEKINLDWVELAERETELFRQDMAALRVLAPAHFVGAVESIPLVVDLVQRLDAAGAVYRVEDDLYFSVTADPAFGGVSGWDRARMLEIFGERGGDPDRAGKRDPLDCVVWRGERPGEPSWDSPFGRGRPGWHIECTAIALEHLGHAFDVQAGGSDLVFPHHEMCAGEAQVALPGAPVRQGLRPRRDGRLRRREDVEVQGQPGLRLRPAHSEIDPMAIRLVLLRHHYRSDWEWTDDQLWDAVDTVESWRKALSLGAGAPARPVVEAVLAALADDLDAPTALDAVQVWADATLGVTGHLADDVRSGRGRRSSARCSTPRWGWPSSRPVSRAAGPRAAYSASPRLR